MNDRLPATLKAELETLFQDRVRFNKIERLVYSHDMGVLPSQVMSLLDNTPDAVAQPLSADEVMAAVKLAARHKLPLVPRGSGTSGFGGAIPTRGGLVLDFVRMNKVLAIDPDEMTVTVEPGVVWGDLEKYLQARGYALRLYPSSAPSATAAGWVAQGGSGYGSYEFGFCGENIVEVEAVMPDGSVSHFRNDDLNYINGLCGITGVILKVTLMIKETDEEVAMLAAFDDLNDAVNALQTFRSQKLPLWSVSMSTPGYIRLKQKASQHIVLPEDRYFLTIVYPKARKSSLENNLKTVINSCRGEVMNDKLARDEWNERFYPMRFKKLGPTLIASEVVIPIDKIAEFVSEVEKKYKGEFALEGTMIHDDKMAILGFMLSDERKAGFPLAYANSLTVIEMGEKLGGRVFTLGLYFADKAKDLLGEAQVDQIWRYKQQVDPNGILNPGKVIPSYLDKNSPVKLLSKAMSVANAGKSLFSLAGKLMDKVQGDTFRSPVSEQITKDTFACALCGYCRNTCTVFDAIPWESNSPRGKYYLLTQYIKGNIPMDEELSKALFSCTTCKKCDFVCQIQAHNAHNWMSLRPCFHANGLENTGLAAVRENVLKTGNFWGVPADNRFAWLDVPTLKKGKVAYWAGCWANVVMSNMPQNITRIFNKTGVDFVHFGADETCCGLYLALGGYMDDFTALVKKNLEMFREAGIDTMVFSCPGCYATFSENYPVIAEQLGVDCNIKFRHVVYYLSELVNLGRLKFTNPVNCKVTYHDSCHVGRWFGHYEEPRNVMKAIPGVELVEMPSNRENALCCGLVSAFDSLPTVAHSGVKRVNEAEATCADFLITNCAGCGSQFNATSCAMNTKVRQKDITELVAQGLGLETQDPTENVGNFMTAAVELLKTSTMTKTR